MTGLNVKIRATLLVLALVALPDQGRAVLPPAMPGPAPRGHVFDVTLRNAACEGCHTDIAGEWRASQHRRAHTDPLYQRALAIEPMAFCRGCHAPEADPTRFAAPALGALGVGCVTCHVSGDDVLASPGRVSPRNSHAVLRDARFAADGACAGCHDFRFPSSQANAERMQATAHEHASSPSASTPCAACHMPAVDGARGKHRSHDFAVTGALVRSAARVTASRVAPGTVQITLAPSGVGHAFPTGDLFRRIEVRAEAIGTDFNVVASKARYLARHWQTTIAQTGSLTRIVARDDRLSATGEAMTVDLDLEPRAAGYPVAWRVAYQRVLHPRSDSEDESVVGDEIVLASGTLPTSRKALP